MRIEEIAKLDKLKTHSELDLKLKELKLKKYKILECIIYVKINQNCSLIEAKSIVVNSSAWINEKEEFMKHQEEQFEEFIDVMKEDKKSIKMVYKPDRKQIKVN